VTAIAMQVEVEAAVVIDLVIQINIIINDIISTVAPKHVNIDDIVTILV
jgi:hypothetical protein